MTSEYQKSSSGMLFSSLQVRPQLVSFIHLPVLNSIYETPGKSGEKEGRSTGQASTFQSNLPLLKKCFEFRKENGNRLLFPHPTLYFEGNEQEVGPEWANIGLCLRPCVVGVLPHPISSSAR